MKKALYPALAGAVEPILEPTHAVSQNHPARRAKSPTRSLSFKIRAEQESLTEGLVEIGPWVTHRQRAETPTVRANAYNQ